MVISTVLSTACSALNVLRLAQSQRLGFALIIAAMIFYFASAVTMISYYHEKEDRGVYLLSNVIAYVIFATVSILLNFLTSTFDVTMWYIWFFLVTNAINFFFNTEAQVPTILSMLIFHGIGLAVVFGVPTVMKFFNSENR